MRPVLEVVRPTTFIQPIKLRELLGIDVTLVSETFQHTGSFKFRAAYNVALNVVENEVLTASSGNFGQAMAYACKLTGKKCTVIMPKTSAQVKIDAVRGYGATVDLIDTTWVGRNERAAQLRAEMPQAYYASPYDDQFVIDGNSTLAEEMMSKYDFDSIISPVGGGGLISGITLGYGRNHKQIQIFGAEPLLANDAARSLRAGELIPNEKEPTTIADGARTISLGMLNWPIIRKGVTAIFEVPDDAIAEATRLYFELANLKCEPTGALPLAALMMNTDRFRNQKVCLIVSGGNVDPAVYAGILQS